MSHDTPWTPKALRRHLQSAVDLEFWTIPFYMSAMYSVTDPTTEAYQLVRSVVYQEMLHVELACNVANAFDVSVSFRAPRYERCRIPHLEFDLDQPDPTHVYNPWNSTIGPLDVERINAMCLIEYPEWPDPDQPAPRPEQEQYGSIGEFYAAVKYGATRLADEIKGNVRQVDLFQRYYARSGPQTVTEDGQAGLPQVLGLLEAITEQGEGQSDRYSEIPERWRNTADDPEAVVDHFDKFVAIRESGRLPVTYEGEASPGGDSPGGVAQKTLVRNFKAFRRTLESLFGGDEAPDFAAQMATLGGNILACWQRGAIPRFS